MDNIELEIHGSDLPCQVELRTDIGGRREQQDGAYVYCDPDMAFAVVCDGMGGTEQGAKASAMAVGTARAALAAQPPHEPVRFLLDTLMEMDDQIFRELGRKKGGTTAVMALLRHGKLYWASAGDSRLYIFRDGELVQATRDHNYFLRLREQLQNGTISQEQFRLESERGEALISYLGVGGLTVYDLTNAPLALKEGDILLLTTDGLYKAVPQEQIHHILGQTLPLADLADRLMTQITARKDTIILDNSTFALIKINARGISDG